MPPSTGRAAHRPRVPPRAASLPDRGPVPRPSPITSPIDLFTPWADPRRPGTPVRSHLDWAENIARLIARAYGGFDPRSQEADDLVAVAHLTLVRLAPRFDPARVPPGGDPNGQFRGLAHVWVQKECEREADRIRSAGFFNTTGDEALKAAGRSTAALPAQSRCPNCRDVQEWWADDEEDEAEVVTTRAEPTLVILRNGVAVG